MATPWLNLPAEIQARSPYDKDVMCTVRVGKEDAVKAAQNRRREPLYNFWSVLNGEAPPIPNTDLLDCSGLSSLSEAHACFRGLCRPCAEDDDGSTFAVYVIKPRYHFAHEPTALCLANRREVPHDVVFVAYVRLDTPCEPNPASSKGCLTHWQFVEADASGSLPIEFGTRYADRYW